jgi:hypothetical protein
MATDWEAHGAFEFRVIRIYALQGDKTGGKPAFGVEWRKKGFPLKMLTDARGRDRAFDSEEEARKAATEYLDGLA